MIVDVHYHLMPRMTESSVSALMPLIAGAAGRMGRRLDMEALQKEGLETWADPTGERLLETMETAGIDHTVICMVDNASQPGLKAESVQKGNRMLGGVASRNPGRIGGLCGIDPQTTRGPRYVEAMLRGVRCHRHEISSRLRV